MRQAGSSFAIATRISAKVIEDLPPNYASDGGGFFSLDVPREALLRMVQDGADEAPGPAELHPRQRRRLPDCLRQPRL